MMPLVYLVTSGWKFFKGCLKFLELCFWKECCRELCPTFVIEGIIHIISNVLYHNPLLKASSCSEPTRWMDPDAFFSCLPSEGTFIAYCSVMFYFFLLKNKSVLERYLTYLPFGLACGFCQFYNFLFVVNLVSLMYFIINST